MRRRRGSERGNHADYCLHASIMPKCNEIAASLNLAGWLGFAPRKDEKRPFMNTKETESGGRAKFFWGGALAAATYIFTTKMITHV